MVYDERALRIHESNCRDTSIALTERRKRMARLVKGSKPIENFDIDVQDLENHDV